MRRLHMLVIPVIVGSLAVASTYAEDKAKPDQKEIERKQGRKLLTKFREQYHQYTAAVVKSRKKSAAERVKLYRKSTQTINALLKPHVKTWTIKEILPEVPKIRAIDLMPTLTAVVLNNPHKEVKAMATYAVAVHLHNTGRDEKRAIALLKSVQKKYPKVRFGENTLGELAQRNIYIFENLAIGKPAPDVKGEDVDGAKFRISDYRGKVIVLRFWGDWCPFCRAMFPQERELVKNLADKPFVLLGVNSDPRPRLRTALKKRKLVWRSFWDGGNTTGPIAKAYQVSEWPTIYVIDHKGIIRQKGEGVRGGRARWLEPVLKKLIAEAEKDLQTSTK